MLELYMQINGTIVEEVKKKLHKLRAKKGDKVETK
jgi:hypothetical protein